MTHSRAVFGTDSQPWTNFFLRYFYWSGVAEM